MSTFNVVFDVVKHHGVWNGIRQGIKKQVAGAGGSVRQGSREALKEQRLHGLTEGDTPEGKCCFERGHRK